MQSIWTLLALGCATTIGYAALNFPRERVLLCSSVPITLLCLVSAVFSLPYGMYFWMPVGLMACAAAMGMQSERGDYPLILAAALQSAEVMIIYQQIWLLCYHVDVMFAWIVQLTTMVAGVYAGLSGYVQLLDREKWRLLWDSATEKSFRQKQAWILLEMFLQTIILIGMERITDGIIGTFILLAVAVIFFEKTRTGMRYCFLESEIAQLQDINNSSQRFFHTVRSQRHDFMLHVHTIYGLLIADQTAACKEYLKKLSEEAQEINTIIPLDKPAVCALLSEYLAIAEQEKIVLTYSIKHDMNQIVCSEFELNRIIGNMLQNAVDEVVQYQPDGRWIKLLIIKRSGRSVIKVTNCFRRNPKELANVMEMNVSTKKQHEGIGMKNIERIVKKYGGVFFIELEDGEINVVAQIPDKVGQLEGVYENSDN